MTIQFERWVVGLLSLCCSAVMATEIIHYKNVPLTIQLQKDQERSIQFGDHVQVGITRGQQQQRLMRVQSAQGAVHVLPYKEFDKQRVQIKRMTDGRVILLDLISTDGYAKGAPLEDIKIVLESENVVPEEEKQVSESAMDNAPNITPVDLTRYASQQLYGPSRLHRDVAGISRSSLGGVDGAIKVFKGANKYLTYSKPIMAYQGGGYYLAAIHIKNTSAQSLQLDYLDLNLPFTHATLQHHSLYPNGTPGDSTVLYLISDKPLKDTLYPWTYYHDIQAEVAEQRRTATAQK